MSVELSSLSGDEWYAVYASITSNVNTIGLFSPIAYFRTLQRQPEPILSLRGESLSRSTIELVWQPPSKPNGPITTYMVYYAPIDDRLPSNNWKLLCLMKGKFAWLSRANEEMRLCSLDRWRSEVSMPMSEYNLTETPRCSKAKTRGTDIITNNDEEVEEDPDENKDVDQVVTDLSILEYQLINSVSQRKEPIFIRSELKDIIINGLDHYFEDKSSALNDYMKSESEEQPVVEHKPYISDFNLSVPTTKVIVKNLEEAQMYMFQVYACHNLSEVPLSDACSLNGIITTVRTKPGDCMCSTLSPR